MKVDIRGMVASPRGQYFVVTLPNMIFIGKYTLPAPGHEQKMRVWMTDVIEGMIECWRWA